MTLRPERGLGGPCLSEAYPSWGVVTLGQSARFGGPCLSEASPSWGAVTLGQSERGLGGLVCQKPPPGGAVGGAWPRRGRGLCGAGPHIPAGRKRAEPPGHPNPEPGPAPASPGPAMDAAEPGRGTVRDQGTQGVGWGEGKKASSPPTTS